jgi:MYXO-CTERM domain-containing protein
MYINRSLLLLGLSLLPSVASAQVKPKIMIIFDTSGSMTSGGNDGSPLCSSQGQSSRIYQLKVAFMEVLQGMGANEMDFALATFPMFVDPTRTPYCAADSHCNGQPPNSCAGHYYVTNAQDSEHSSSNNACKVSTHNPATQQTASCATAACPWYTDYKNEVLKVPFGNPPEKVMIYFDQQEDAGALPAGQPLTNPEVRSNDNWYTPLGKSLFYAHGYFDKEVALPATDYRKACERLVVAMFTDGGETCDDTTNDPFYPTKWATNLNNNLKVVTHTVAIDTTEGLVQSIATAGKGGYYQVSGNTAALKTAFLDIVAKSQPPTELCNGKDDDCDNLVDEDFPLKGQPCNNGKLGVCYKTGVYVCNAAGTGVVCNAPDATGTAEICNGLDDDCDGQIDEDLPGCIPPVCQPEVCNGKDDDCDGKTDNGIPSVACGKDVGECKAGMTDCVAGVPICKGGSLPKPEICNGLDDDCDGVRDGFAEPCYSFPTGCDLKTGVCTGMCKLGSRLCTAVQTGGVWGGQWGSCTGDVGPAKEICDGIDNNCDGTIDEGAECPGGAQCINGACSNPCSGSEFSCPTGQLCKNGWCVADPCDAVECGKKGGVCKAGECIDLCANITCGKLELCVKGVCVDNSCYSKGCPTGERCVAGVCQKDACFGVQCRSDEICLDGKCIKGCDAITCKPGETCRLVTGQAQCVTDPCASVNCTSPQVCVDGKCSTDPCEAVRCDKGQVCSAGKCVEDVCERVRCPNGYRCTFGVCEMLGVESTKDLLASGGGGCACSVQAAPSTAPLLWVLAVLLFVLRRRR